MMLSGEKHLAVFSDALIEGRFITEDIIPEQKFAAALSRGHITRHAEDIYFSTKNITIRYVCFAANGHEWRAEFYLWYHRQWASGAFEYHPAHELILGSLLGYTRDDISAFMQKLE